MDPQRETPAAASTIQTTPAPINHIGIDERGIARIVGHRTRVVDIVLDTRTGMTPQMIHEAYPDLTLAEIHAALSYYFDHQSQLDDVMQRQLKDYEAGLIQQDKNPPRVVQRLESLRAAGSRSDECHDQVIYVPSA